MRVSFQGQGDQYNEPQPHPENKIKSNATDKERGNMLTPLKLQFHLQSTRTEYMNTPVLHAVLDVVVFTIIVS
jgi:hypothetical protein